MRKLVVQVTGTGIHTQNDKSACKTLLCAHSEGRDIITPCMQRRCGVLTVRVVIF